MNQTTTLKDIPSKSIPFAFKRVSLNAATNIGTILQKHNSGLFNISGALNWLGPESVVIDKQGKEKRVQDASNRYHRCIEVSLWGMQISEVHDDQLYSLSACKLKQYNLWKKNFHSQRRLLSRWQTNKTSQNNQLIN